MDVVEVRLQVVIVETCTFKRDLGRPRTTNSSPELEVPFDTVTEDEGLSIVLFVTLRRSASSKRRKGEGRKQSGGDHYEIG